MYTTNPRRMNIVPATGLLPRVTRHIGEMAGGVSHKAVHIGQKTVLSYLCVS